MTALTLARTSYRGQDGTPRPGDTTRAESLLDVEAYTRPMEQVHGSEVHHPGVAAGFAVTATVGEPGVVVTPGVAVDSTGRHLSLAQGGRARVGATLVEVGGAGVPLTTSGLSGSRYVTVTFAETFVPDQDGPPRLEHTPALALLPADAGQQPPKPALVLAVVSLDAAGTVTELSHKQRIGSGLPAERIELRRPARIPASGALTVEHQPTAQVRARAAGGLDVLVGNATDEITIGRDGGGAARVSIAADSLVAGGGDGTQALTLDTATASLGIGPITGPRAALHVPDRGLQIGTGANGSGNFSWAADSGGGVRGLRLYGGDAGTGTPLLTVLGAGGGTGTGGGTGAVGIGTANPSQPLTVQAATSAFVNLRVTGGAEALVGADTNGGLLATSTNHDLRLRAGSTTAVTIKTDGRVGLGTASPNRKLTIQADGAAFLNVRATGGAETLLGAESGAGVLSASKDLKLQAGGSTTRVIVNAAGNVGVGTTSPGFRLDVDDRIRLRQGASGTAGTWLFQSGPNADRAFVGMAGDNSVGLWGNTGAGWGLTMDTTTGHVGIGTGPGDAGPRLEVVDASDVAGFHSEHGLAVVASSEGGLGPWGALAVSNIPGSPSINTGVIGLSSLIGGLAVNFAGYFDGDVHVSGTLSKAAGQFRIDHPLDPANRYLCHSFVESDEMKNVYDGVVALDTDGRANVVLPDWCEVLNESFRYQLTPIGAPAPDLHIAGEPAGNGFEIAGGPPGARVCWQLTGRRADPYARAHPLTVEDDKPEHERGYYLHPELYGQSEQHRVTWAHHPALRELRENRRRAAAN